MLQEYMDKFSLIYDMSKVPRLPNYTVPMGRIQTTDKKTGSIANYIFILKNFDVDLAIIRDDPKVKNLQLKKMFTFMLIMPKDILDSKL
jgi:hypothetical protein